MKIKLEFDVTPAELRESLGLPDISGLQEKAISALQSRLTKDIKDVNVAELVESWFTQGVATSRQVQKMFGAVIGGAMDSGSGTTSRRKKKSDD